MYMMAMLVSSFTRGKDGPQVGFLPPNRVHVYLTMDVASALALCSIGTGFSGIEKQCRV